MYQRDSRLYKKGELFLFKTAAEVQGLFSKLRIACWKYITRKDAQMKNGIPWRQQFAIYIPVLKS